MRNALGSALVDVAKVEGVDDGDIREGVIAVYRGAFRARPYCRGEEDFKDFAESLVRHTDFAGFRMIVARSHSDGSIVGFSYGYDLAPGQWWYEHVAPQLPFGVADLLLDDAFLLTQLAVLPAFQRQGIGRQLHDALLERPTRAKALLSTRQADSPAQRLYRSRGWRLVSGNVDFPGANHPYQILELPLNPTSAMHRSEQQLS